MKKIHINEEFFIFHLIFFEHSDFLRTFAPNINNYY